MGTPTILIQDGKLLIKGLRKVKFDMNDLLEQCRESGYFNIDEIAFAIMEADGKISFLPKAEYKVPTLKDLNLKAEKSALVANIIIDGNIMDGALKNMHKDRQWLEHQIKVQNKNLKDILLGTLDQNQKVILYEKNVNEIVQDVLE